jgi:2-iminobutanoate/2-iminopropanoate deaminase
MKAPKPVGPYSQAIRTDKFLFVSGQLAINPKDGRIIEGGIKEQTIQIMDNIGAILEAAGFTFNNVVMSNVYLSSMALFSEFNNTYAKFFKNCFPARATVGIELAPKALVEISVVAYKE